MYKMYISSDVEASGRTPGKYSMLSLGSCIVSKRDIQFYIELKPISSLYDVEAMRVGCRGLEVLRKRARVPELDPWHPKFKPDKVLEILDEEGETPTKAMEEYAQWIRKHTIGYKPVEAAAPIKYDGGYTEWYFDNFYDGENPFGHSGEDINSMYRMWKRDENASIKDAMPKLTHNALEDALAQEIPLALMVKYLREKL